MFRPVKQTPRKTSSKRLARYRLNRHVHEHLMRAIASGRACKTGLRLLILLACDAFYAVLIPRLDADSPSPPPGPDTEYGRLKGSSSRHAFATLLTSEDEDYFAATRLLNYQLRVDTETRTNVSVPFVVMVTRKVPKLQRQHLALEGATFLVVEDIPLPW